MPVSPVQNIPPFEDSRKQTSVRRSPRKSSGAGNEGNEQGREGVLIDFGTPTNQPAPGTDSQANPFDTFNASSAIAAAREREESEQRERERKMILEQREARRKSMGPLQSSFWYHTKIPNVSQQTAVYLLPRRPRYIPGTLWRYRTIRRHLQIRIRLDGHRL